MRIALLTTDNRENFRDYQKSEPVFGSAPEALLQGMAEIPELEVHVLSCAQQRMVSPPKLARNIWFHSLLVPKIGWLRTGYQGCVRAVRKKLRQIQPLLVHAQGTERDCALSGVLSGFANVLTIHGNMRRVAAIHHTRPLSFHWLTARLEAWAVPRADGIICITNYTHELVCREARRTWVVPNAVDPQFFAINAQPGGTRTILCVGSICLHKNQNDLIESLDSLAASIKFRLLFLGGVDRADAYGQRFLDLVAQRPWCHFAGFATREALRVALQTATMLVLPSLEDNCPMAVLEAMAAGVPVMAAKIGGVPDLIEEGVTGLFCEPKNPESIVEGVQKLLENAALGSELAKRAKERALLRFHPVAIAWRHWEIYQEVLATNS